MNFSLKNYWKYFPDIKPEIMDWKKGYQKLKCVFVEDISSSIGSDTRYQLDLQFFRIIQAMGLKESNYLFIRSKDFRYSDRFSFKRVFVLGKDSFDSLEKNQEFIKYKEKYGTDCIERLPSSFEMYSNIQLKKEAWDKLKKVLNY